MIGSSINILTAATKNFAAACAGSGDFFGLPKWYEYLPGDCDFTDIKVDQLGLIGLAFVDILLHVAGLVAVGYIIWGGVQFITAQGDPGATKKARQTIINAIIGLIIALIATGVVKFIGNKLG
jgi:hypothetical protein